MAQGEFTKEEAQACDACLKEIMESFPRKKCLDFIGHFNDIFLFLAAAKKIAPNEKP